MNNSNFFGVNQLDPIEFTELVAKIVNRGSSRRYCKSRVWGGNDIGYGGVPTADRYGGTPIAERIAGLNPHPVDVRL